MVEGEGCPRCGEPLKLGKAVEIGHIFKLGTKYAESMGARFWTRMARKSRPSWAATASASSAFSPPCIEQNHDDNGFWLAAAIAPFTVVVVPTNVKDATLAEAVGKNCRRAGSRRATTCCSTTAMKGRE